MGRASSISTAQKILDIAEQLAQVRGFNGFSYADIADELAVTKASLHYHFRSKAELGRALIVRYRSTFNEALAEIDQTAADAVEKLRRYVDLYEAVMRNNRVCLCGMFAAEYVTLPEPMREELRHFFETNERWLSRVLTAGRHEGTLAFNGPARERARCLLGALEGTMLVARSCGDEQRFRSAAHRLVADVIRVDR
jgi:TetR/AcrR family transcriptional repressor of nem operon